MKKVIRMSAMTLTLVMALVIAACSGSGVNPDVKKVADVLSNVSDNYSKLESDPNVAAQTLSEFMSLRQYADSDVALTPADRDCLADAFYKLVKASGESFSKEEIRAEFDGINTLGEVASNVYSMFMSGVSEAL